MDYVLTGAYKTQPNFQRYIEHKSDKLREQGITVDIWKCVLLKMQMAMF
jgi:hypothetical protein